MLMVLQETRFKSYLTNCWQITKVNTNFSSWSELVIGVPQESVFGPLLFNTYIYDLFYITEMTNVCNYADDTTFYVCDSDLERKPHSKNRTC